MIFHLAERAAWAEACTRGEYCPPSLVLEGFIHLSTVDQVLGTANRFYQGRSDLLLLSVDERGLQFRALPVSG